MTANRVGFAGQASLPARAAVRYNGRQVTHDDGRPILADDELTLYHETSAERAGHLREHGTLQDKPVGARTVDSDYEPGRGMGRGLYLMHTPHAAGGVFGDTVLPVRVRAGDLAVPPERAHRIPHGMTPLRSLMVGDGYTEIPLPHQAFGEPIRRQAPRPGDGSFQGAIEQRARQHTAGRFTPDKRVFTHTDGLDHRLFDGEHLRPEVRSYILGTITSWWADEYRDWSKWAKIFFAGSEASEWTSPTLEGNNDLDILVGVDYDGCRAANPQLAELTDQQITDRMNAGFRAHNGPVTLTVDGIQYGPFDRTTFVNKDSWDISRIKPYSAYDVGADSWVVKPPHLPHWSLSELPKPVQQVLRAADSYARHVLKLPEPERTQQGAALFEAWHTDRSRAFSERGEGWWDIANLREKWGDQQGWWAQLVECAHRAKQGLDAAPADWSNTPYGAKQASYGDYLSGGGLDGMRERIYSQPQHHIGDEWQTDEYPGTVGWVRTDKMLPLRHHDGTENGRSPEVTHALTEGFQHGEGWLRPLHLNYSAEDHATWLAEGNHRLEAARRAGETHVPVTIGHVRGGDLPSEYRPAPFPQKVHSYSELKALRGRSGDTIHPVHILPADWLDGGSRKTAKLPKTQKCDYCEQQATKRVIWAEGMAYTPVCDEHEQRAKDHVGDDYCNTRPIPKTAGAGSPDHRQGYEHGLVGARGNLPFIERTQARGHELEPEDHDYLAGHAAGTQEKQRRDQHRAETGEYKCQQCAGTGMGRWRGTSTCNECRGSGSISQEAAHKTDTLYHVTDNPHFTPNAHHVPEDNTVAIENRSRPGLYAAHKDDVEHWTRGEGYVRPYVAEIHVLHHAHEPGRWGGERFIPAEHFDKVKVTRIIPLSAHGTNYRGPDARDMTPEQHAVHKQHALDTLRDEHDFGPEDIDHLRRAWAAASSTMYHWAPQDARDDIAQHGLDHTRAPDFDPAKQGPHGVFLHHNEDLARDWVPDIERTHDLYAVDTHGLSLRPDPYDTGDASYTERPVPPDRLRRLVRTPSTVAAVSRHMKRQAAGYGYEHRPPGPPRSEDYYDGGQPAHDLDFGRTGTSMYGDGSMPGSRYRVRTLQDHPDTGVRSALRAARGNPDHPITMYRALPHEHVAGGFHTGDWVTLSKSYAQSHARNNGGWPVIRATVPARHLWTNGDYNEWGYHGPDVQGEIHTRGRQATRAVTSMMEATAGAQVWITPQLVMGSAAGLNHARQVNSASEAVAAVQQGLTAVLPPDAWFPVRQVLLGLGMSLLDVTQRLKQFGAPSSVTG